MSLCVCVCVCESSAHSQKHTVPSMIYLFILWEIYLFPLRPTHAKIAQIYGRVAQMLFCIVVVTICITPIVLQSSPEWSQDTPVSAATKSTRGTAASRPTWSVTTFASETTPSRAAETAGSSSSTVSVNVFVVGLKFFHI